MTESSFAFSEQQEVVMPTKIATAKKKGRPVIKEKAAAGAKINGPSVDWELLLGGLNGGKSVLEYGANRNIFMQG
jgi:hypothetical protein